MPDISKLPPLVQYVITAISSAVALLATQGLIDNRWEKLVTGLASILIPLGYLVYAAVVHASNARVTAARIISGQPTQPHVGP
jgi:hypothetical protein